MEVVLFEGRQGQFEVVAVPDTHRFHGVLGMADHTLLYWRELAVREQNIIKTTRVSIPPKTDSDWQESAKCYGRHPVTIEMCDGCPVVPQCRLLYKKLNATVQIELGGVWGGIDHDPINAGLCSYARCDKVAYRRGTCSLHYQRELKAEKRNKLLLKGVILELDKGDIDG